MPTKKRLSASFLLLLTTTASAGTFGDNPIGPPPLPSSSLTYTTAQIWMSGAEAVRCDATGTDPIATAQVINLDGTGSLGVIEGGEHCTLRLLDAELVLEGVAASGPGSFDVALDLGDLELSIPAADADVVLWLELDPDGEDAIFDELGGGALSVQGGGPLHDDLVDAWVEEAELAP